MVFRGKPSKACQRCRQRRLRCDQKRPSCTSCVRVGEPCTGYRETSTIRFSDETAIVKSKALAKGDPFTKSQEEQRSGVGPYQFRYGFQDFRRAPQSLRHLPQDLAILGRDMFFAYYVSDFNRTWDFLFPYIDKSVTPEYVTLGIDAVSLAFLSVQVSSEAARDLAWRKYTLALRNTGKALEDVKVATSQTTLEAALLLDLFEKIMQCGPEFNSNRHAHVQGAIALVKLRGLESFKAPPELRSLMGLTLNSTVCSLSMGIPVPPEIREIRDYVSQFADTSYPKWKLSEVITDLTDMAAAIRTGDLTGSELLEQCLAHDARLQQIALEAGPSWAFERKPILDHTYKDIVPEGFPLVYDVYPNRVITQMWNVLRIVRILICDEIIETTASLEDAESEKLHHYATNTVVEMIRNICASVPQMTNCEYAASHKLPDNGVPGTNPKHTHTISHILDVYILVFSLYIVAWARIGPIEARDWAKGQLQRILEHFDIVEAGIIMRAIEEQERDGPNNRCLLPHGVSPLTVHNVGIHCIPAGSFPLKWDSDDEEEESILRKTRPGLTKNHALERGSPVSTRGDWTNVFQI